MSHTPAKDLLERLAKDMNLPVVDDNLHTREVEGTVYRDVEHLLHSVMVACLAREAFAIGCMSPILIGEHFLSGWREVDQRFVKKHSVAIEMLDSEVLNYGKGHSANAIEYLEYNREKSISVELMNLEDSGKYRDMIFEAIERTYTVMTDLLLASAKAQVFQKSTIYFLVIDCLLFKKWVTVAQSWHTLRVYC